MIAERLDSALEFLGVCRPRVECDRDEVLVVVPIDPRAGMRPFQGLGDLVRSPASCRAGGRLLETEDVERHFGDFGWCGGPLLRPCAGEEGQRKAEE